MTQADRKDDVMKGAEFLLVGELGETDGSIAISARLIDAGTGSVIATAQTSAPLDASLTMAGGETTTAPGWVNVNAAYGAARYLRLGAGISNMRWNEFVREDVPASGNNFKHYRNYNLSGIGPRLFTDFLLPVHPRLNLGLRGDVIFMPGMKLEQDVAEIRAWELNPANGQTPYEISQRVLVTATGKGMTIFKPAFIAEFLISSRVSFSASVGYMLSTVFRPQVFEANGERHWTDDGDFNGTFAKYQNYNFARRANGKLVEFEMGFVFVDIGVSLHF